MPPMTDPLPPLLPDRSLRDHPVRPRHGLSWPRALLWRAVWVLFVLLDVAWFRLRVRGKHDLPKDGPALVLSNHTGTLDSFWTGYAMGRPLHFMAATSVLRIPFFGRVAAALGAFGKKKYVRDTASLKVMMQLLRDGEAVVVYPEGTRTWDGRPLPVIPGLGRLVRKMKVPVIYTRLENTFLFNPRWATWPRFIPVRITFDGPYRYGPEWSAADIEADIQRKLATQPELPDRGLLGGFRLAHGLPGYLWACPACGGEEALALDPTDGDAVTCRSCRSGWRLDLACVLHGRADAPTLTLAEAIDRLAAHVGTPPVPDRRRLDDRGLVLVAPGATVLRCLPESSETEAHARGTLELSPTRLRVVSTDGVEQWGAELADLQSVTVEVAQACYVRVGGELYQLLPGEQSTTKWGAVTRAWRAHVRGRPDPDAIRAP